MTPSQKRRLVKYNLEQGMARLPFVQWDRWTANLAGDQGGAFGWIARADGRADFVLLRATPDAIGQSTSSAERSAEISHLLHGGASKHVDCRRIEDDFPEIENVVRLGKL
jgi:hypothetical protein